MALAHVSRAVQAGLALYGEPALLDGAEAGKVVVQFGVTVDKGDADRADDNYTAPADIAVIAAQYAPRAGQVLEHPEGRFKLVRKVIANGYALHFTIVRLPA
jgi:hypothetical protein